MRRIEKGMAAVEAVEAVSGEAEDFTDYALRFLKAARIQDVFVVHEFNGELRFPTATLLSDYADIARQLHRMERDIIQRYSRGGH